MRKHLSFFFFKFCDGRVMFDVFESILMQPYLTFTKSWHLLQLKTRFQKRFRIVYKYCFENTLDLGLLSIRFLDFDCHPYSELRFAIVFSFLHLAVGYSEIVLRPFLGRSGTIAVDWCAHTPQSAAPVENGASIGLQDRNEGQALVVVS